MVHVVLQHLSIPRGTEKEFSLILLGEQPTCFILAIDGGWESLAKTQPPI